MNFINIISFLNDLKSNNNRDWFNKNKDNYIKTKIEFDKITGHLIKLIHEIDPSIGLPEPEECVFRIYRDVRFSKNKDPYKIHYGAYISDGGRKSKKAGYYFHLQPGESFVAAGAYMPEPALLKEIRHEIVDNYPAFKAIIEDKNFKKIFPSVGGEKLKTLPQGFPKDFEGIEIIKLKSFEVFCPVSDKVLLSPDFEDFFRKAIKTALPYNSFFNRIISNHLDQ
ncbi:MAG: DUF2461 domain-containing protein [Bacteroidales bacterium]